MTHPTDQQQAADAAVSRVMKVVRHEALLAGESTGELFLKALEKKIEEERR